MRARPLVVLALLVACSPGRDRERDRRELAAERAQQIVGLHDAWDDIRAAGVFGRRPEELAPWRESLAWLRPRLGRCGSPRRIDARGRRSHGRFRAACERGALEVEVWIGYGLVDRGRVGGRGIEAAPPVMAAADRFVAEMPLDDRAIARWRVGDDFTGGFAQGLGRCRIAGTDIVGHHSGIFDLECEGGPAQLKVIVHRGGDPLLFRLSGPLSPRHRLPDAGGG